MAMATTLPSVSRVAGSIGRAGGGEDADGPRAEPQRHQADEMRRASTHTS